MSKLDRYETNLGYVLLSLFSVQFGSIQFSSVQFNSIQFTSISLALDNTFTLTYHYSFQFSPIQLFYAEDNRPLVRFIRPFKKKNSTLYSWRKDILKGEVN